MAVICWHFGCTCQSVRPDGDCGDKPVPRDLKAAECPKKKKKGGKPNV